jgi:hypothetical protein
MAATILLTAGWSFVLLDRSSTFLPWLRYLVVAVGAAAAVLLLAVDQLPRKVAMGVAAAAVTVGLAGPAAYSVQTAVTAHSGSIPSAGPAVAGGGFGGRPGGFGGPGGAGGPAGGTTGTPPQGFAGGTPPQGFGGGTPPQGTTGGAGGFGAPGAAGGPGGLLGSNTPGSALTAALESDAGSYTWVAAAVGANSAAGYQLATGLPVMSLGGFNGSDPYPSLELFQQYVSQHKVHYFITGGVGGVGGGRQNGGSNATSAITTWVESHFTATTIGGTTVYDLTQPTTTTSGASPTA